MDSRRHCQTGRRYRWIKAGKINAPSARGACLGLRCRLVTRLCVKRWKAIYDPNGSECQSCRSRARRIMTRGQSAQERPIRNKMQRRQKASDPTKIAQHGHAHLSSLCVWLTRRRKYKVPPKSDKPAYSDDIHRHLGYELVGEGSVIAADVVITQCEVQANIFRLYEIELA